VSKTKLPLLKELQKSAESSKSTSVTFDDFLAALKKFPEFVPVALEITALPVEDRAQAHLSVTAATLLKNEREKLLAPVPAPGGSAGKPAPSVVVAGAEGPVRHTSFAPPGDVEKEQRLSG